MKKLTKTQQEMLDAITRGSWNEVGLPKGGAAGMLGIYPTRLAATLSGENRSRHLITAEILANRGFVEIDYTKNEYGFITTRIAN